MADDATPPRRPETGRRPLLGRLVGAGTRGAGRVAGATGIDAALEEAASAAVVRALESPAAERALAQALESEAVERSMNRVVDSEMIDRVWERLLASDEAQKLVERIAEAPEVRQAIAAQGVGLIDDLGAQVARVTRHLDDVVESFFRTLLRRPKRDAEPRNAGLISRGVAFAIDGGILNLIFLAASTLIASAASVALGVGGDVSLEAALAGTAIWLAASSTYLVAFWSLSGETPGMRFLDIRLEGPDGRRIGLRRALRRLVGVALSILPFGLGLLMCAWEERRRTFADRFAQTEVRYLEPKQEAPWSGDQDASR